MKAVILAAGEGTRMRPLTSSRPKVMLPVANKPIIEYILESAISAGIEQFVIVTGYCSQVIEDYFRDGKKWGASIEYVQQEKARGTAHAIEQAKGHVDARFIVLNGDMMVSSKHLRDLIKSDKDTVLSVKRVENPSDYGIINIDNNLVTEIVEKPEKPDSNLANAGIYLFDEKIFQYISMTPPSSRGEIEITSTLEIMLNKGLEIGYRKINENWMDIGRPWDLLNANEIILDHVKEQCHGTVEPNATLHGRVSIGKGTIIRNGAYIVGPVIIGENCDIGPNCYIRPHTAIGNRVRIGNAVEIKNSIVMDSTNIGHLSYVGDSIIGTGCNFGAGTKVANLRHDGKNIKVTIKGQKIDSRRRKLGVIMGDNVHTAINTSINTGTIIASGQWTEPGEVVRFLKE
ncbi:Nucleotidyl transferase [Methanosalsum zhilinae DSM 4017]|uniref:Bifunctional protein GlmU n=1 Tax=Methanosalsum zhilinae (strain DSM 4017 / NBRC 107636 / OCM 62 / WeN5) TaxID=679901 RepID=F7XPX1_METZD|nr:bifunctional sugar-1-phosphate nucleotidylyltransferase/acetyltransferase [Methanosalsum zhilinae]AEH61492.1 Nucleotidyl transferase [Methanosalsum zhilinae DSM 4017]